MPLYEYKCSKCGHVFSKLLWDAKDEKELKCPVCGEAKVERQISQVGGTGSGCSTDTKPNTGYTRRYG
ncbi:MAG: zinc ribbon domain-containing protein [Dehalococcoidia bacterium]|nr:zinc ribbon domain-containing protein [Dehalococcoidia bacterium]